MAWISASEHANEQVLGVPGTPIIQDGTRNSKQKILLSQNFRLAMAAGSLFGSVFVRKAGKFRGSDEESIVQINSRWG